MRTVAEYRVNADECRKLAKLMAKPDDKGTLAQMAQTWQTLAVEREYQLQSED